MYCDFLQTLALGRVSQKLFFYPSAECESVHLARCRVSEHLWPGYVFFSFIEKKHQSM